MGSTAAHPENTAMHLRGPGLLVPLLLTGLPATAWALPGPEVVVPILLGFSQAVLLCSVLLRSAVPGWLRVRVGLVLLVTIGLWLHPVLAILVAWPLWTPRRALPALSLVCLLLLTLLFGTRFDPPPPLLDAASTPAPVMHVGEQEDFRNCHVPGVPLVRPADLADLLGDDPAPVTLLAFHRNNVADALPAQVRVENLLQTYGTDMLVCYSAAFSGALRSWISFGFPDEMPGAPHQTRIYRVRAHDVPRLHAAGTRPIQTRTVLETSTPELRRYANARVYVVGTRTFRHNLSAVRLLEEAGASVAGVTPAPALPVTAPAPFFPLIFGMVLSGLSVGALTLIGTRRAARRAGSGQDDGASVNGLSWLALVCAIGLTGPLLARFLSLGAGGAPWVTPLSWGQHMLPWFGAGLIAQSAGLLAITRVAPVRTRTALAFGITALVAAGLPWIHRGEIVPLDLFASGVFLLTASMGAWLPRLARIRRLQDARPEDGGKAAGLRLAVQAGAQVPPAVLVTPTRTGPIRWALGALPTLARSSARDEDRDAATAAGRYATVAADAGDTQRAVETVWRSTGGSGAVVVMPRIPAVESGVLLVLPDEGLVIREEGSGPDGVTSGGAIQRDAFAIAHPPFDTGLNALIASAPGPRYIEYLRSEHAVWCVQVRPAPVPLTLDPAAVADLRKVQSLLPTTAPGALVLTRLFEDGLSTTECASTLAMWSEVWSRSGALGQVLAHLGFPRWLVPEHAVVGAWGQLWSIAPVLRRIEQLLALRGLQGDPAEELLATVGRSEPDFGSLTRWSVALRLARSLLPEGSPVERPTKTLLLARAIRAGDAAAHFPHRGLHDLSPGTPRYGLSGPAPALPPIPATWTQAWVDHWRDAVRDRLAWEVARMPAPSDPPWEGHQPTRTQFTAMSLPSAVVPGSAGASRTGTWVSGTGPLEGRRVTDPNDGGPDHILHIETPTPALAASFHRFHAVVASGGGALSHAALVAREDGIPALFGASVPDSSRIRLCADGRVEARD